MAQQPAARDLGISENEIVHRRPLGKSRSRELREEREDRRSFAEVILDLLAFNPYNPREELTRIEETAKSLKAKGQLQPLAVVSRHAFLEVHPEKERAIGQAKYVVVDGNRRLAAARAAGLTSLRIDVNDSLAESRSNILESSLVANIHRVDVPPLDQAKAIQELLNVYKSQTELAKRLGKSGAWVSQRLALLELPPDLQEKVETGELKVKDARRIGRLPEAQQHDEAKKVLNPVKAEQKQRNSHFATESSLAAAPFTDGHDREPQGRHRTNEPAPSPFSDKKTSHATAAMRTLWELTGDIDSLVDVLRRHLPPSELGRLAERLALTL
ncbi:ParB/RepB/Spo0J family partition protein [Streptomyces hygroscopicus]|uniref:ParB family chromosome partitioning protein n=1 Tax=Streptomyces demainii TaxID=588122 RepID=A0ABT9KHC0_9ACTN|nr:ParB/RepB/Spo0J family partition protein [Streptomyces demainii]MDP9607809.1 ParB family chromosome partitioning protein [Streptomyces demainii]